MKNGTKIFNDLNALIIDDEEDICYLLGSLLKQKQIRSDYANTIKDARDILETKHPELIFLDNHLPDGPGINFIEQIKLINPKAKIIVITAHDSPQDRNNAMKKGADFFIGKPFTQAIVRKVVEDLTA